VLGADCNVASGATLDGPVFGDRCIISQGVAMGPGFLIGDDVFIGPNVTVCNDRWPRTTRTVSISKLQRGFVTVRWQGRRQHRRQRRHPARRRHRQARDDRRRRRRRSRRSRRPSLFARRLDAPIQSEAPVPMRASDARRRS
jgi:carbonic anhydrase/acetyltransferase-like protein (isoleucine patch superfamily)